MNLAGNSSGNPAAKPTDGQIARASSSALALMVVGDQVMIWRSGNVPPKRFPTALEHASQFLSWLTNTKCSGHWVWAHDIQHMLYPEFCRLRGWTARPVQTVLKHLKGLTRKRLRNLQVGEFDWRRNQVQYFVPRRASS